MVYRLIYFNFATFKPKEKNPQRYIKNILSIENGTNKWDWEINITHICFETYFDLFTDVAIVTYRSYDL